ncbi:MAG: hypothetical protein U5K51_03265 [Flavobacteriaceae bacterium]|nr:hypothetical protein [Flavobacteriaceae bacterium]
MQIKIIPSIFMLLCSAYAFAQEATEIYLFDLIENGKSFTIKNSVNISNQKGYDNQPSFTEDGASILFTSFRDGQADIAIYDIEQQYRGWLTNTPENEISPMAYPGKKKLFTCIRSDNKEKQQLYTYSYKGNEPEVLIGDVKIAYYTWFNKNTLVTMSWAIWMPCMSITLNSKSNTRSSKIQAAHFKENRVPCLSVL